MRCIPDWSWPQREFPFSPCHLSCLGLVRLGESGEGSHRDHQGWVVIPAILLSFGVIELRVSSLAETECLSPSILFLFRLLVVGGTATRHGHPFASVVSLLWVGPRDEDLFLTRGGPEVALRGLARLLPGRNGGESLGASARDPNILRRGRLVVTYQC
ncbi:hypothetical protein B0T24DRAFT_609773 [Lasiosphaeria ovina]|uniref:Uncharacterized protein n=1 Tax=Lasiosphaeria ovina TaxID=92902 RepID=A0AAE0KL83_9PEZI|nr:hypothetical protein B0T24DRAFT_609773 [Lasiosphaeria ovina]